MALHATYPSDVHETIIGRVMGPDTTGSAFVVAVSAELIEGGKTRVRFMPLPTGETRLFVDDDRQLRIPVSAIGPDGKITDPDPG